jgi:hypothetical protein
MQYPPKKLIKFLINKLYMMLHASVRNVSKYFTLSKIKIHRAILKNNKCCHMQYPPPKLIKFFINKVHMMLYASVRNPKLV